MVRNEVKRAGEEDKIERACDEVVANIAGSEAEKTEADELIR